MKKILVRFLQLGIVLLLISLVLFFYRYEVSLFNASLKNPLYKYTGSLEWWLYIIYCLIAISIVNIMVISGLNFYFTFTKTRGVKIKKHYETLFTEYLIDYLFPNSLENTEEKDLISKMKRRTNKKIQVLAFFEIFIKIHENVSSDLGAKFIELTEILNLGRKLEKLFYSSNFSDNLLAINLISALGIKKFNDSIRHYTRSSNYALRTEAITALIKLSENNNLSVLNDHSHYISRLDVNVILNAVLRNRKTDIDYLSLLRSGIPNKILIAVLIARHRKLVELKHEIKSLIGHSDETLNYEVWESYLLLEEDKEICNDLIIDLFKSQNEKIKILILSQEMKSPGTQYYDFVTEIIKNDESLAVKTRAMKQLFNNSFDLISQFVNSEDAKISKAFKEVIDFNL